MPPSLRPEVTRRAQELWEQEGLRGNALMAQMTRELLDGREEWTKNLPDVDHTRLPGNRSTLNKMAERLAWKSGEDDDEGPISGIDDPIWHLSSILARKNAHEYTHYDDEFRRLDVEQIVFTICMDVRSAYEPHQKMFKKLRPLVRMWVIQEKKEFQDRGKEAFEAQAQIAAMAEAGLLPQLRAQGLPIDEQHASLGMVYTNPQDQEEVKEDEE